MPTIITRGAASARAYGFGGGAKPASGFLQTVDSGAYGTNVLAVTFDTDNNAYVGLYITSSYGTGYPVIVKLAAGTGSVVWKYSLSNTTVSTSNAYMSLAFYGGYLYVYSANARQITKISTSGTVVESKYLSVSIALLSSGSAAENQMVIDSSGNIYLGGGSYDSGFTTPGYSIVKLNSSYVVQWAKVYYRTPGTYNSNYASLKIGLDNNLSFSLYYDDGTNYYIDFLTVSSSTGFINNSSKTLSAGSTLMYRGDRVTDSSGDTYSATFAGSNVYIYKISSAGALVWKKQIAYSVGSMIDVSVDTQGNSYYLLGGSLSRLIKLDSSGSLLWAKSLTNANGSSENQAKLNINSNLLFGVLSPFAGGYATSYALPSKNGPTNGTYTSKNITIASLTPTLTTPTINDFTNSFTTINQTVTVNATTLTLYAYTLPATSNATVLPA